MAKKFNLALIGLTAISSCFMGLGSDDLSAEFDGADLLGMFFGSMLLPSIVIYLGPVNDLRPPDIGRWSFLPSQPLRFSLFLGSLLLSVGLPGSISVMVFRGVGPDLGMPIFALATGIGLIAGSGIATWKFGDRLVSEDG